MKIRSRDTIGRSLYHGREYSDDLVTQKLISDLQVAEEKDIPRLKAEIRLRAELVKNVPLVREEPKIRMSKKARRKARAQDMADRKAGIQAAIKTKGAQDGKDS